MTRALVVLLALVVLGGVARAQHATNTQTCVDAFHNAHRELKTQHGGFVPVRVQAFDDGRVLATYEWMRGRPPHTAEFTPDRDNERPATEWQQTKLTARRQYASAFGSIEFVLRRPSKTDQQSFGFFYAAFRKAIDACASAGAHRGG